MPKLDDFLLASKVLFCDGDAAGRRWMKVSLDPRKGRCFVRTLIPPKVTGA
jgi:hypothetical protein